MKRQILWLFFFPLLLTGETIRKTGKELASFEITLSAEKIHANESLSMQAAFGMPEGYAIDTSFIYPLFDPINPLSPLFTIRNWKFKQQSFSMAIDPGKENFLFSLYQIKLQPPSSDLEKIQMNTPVFEISVFPPKPFDIQFLPIAPLLPLEPEFPLTLSEANRQAINNPAQLAHEAQRNLALFRERSFPWGTFFYIFNSALLLLFVLVYKQKRRLKSVPEQTFKEKALQTLSILKRKGERQEVDLKELYRELKNLVVTYLEEATQQPLKNRTSEEIKLKIPLDSEQTEFLLDFLNRSNFIVFGNERNYIHWEKDLQKIKGIIQH
ncbi:MAG: hypothetical protein H0V82_06120 [Candidatus Protochlamydia sp.]|nr:hypothetical protein [Candidatus Protochlamydia sp.]